MKGEEPEIELEIESVVEPEVEPEIEPQVEPDIHKQEQLENSSSAKQPSRDSSSSAKHPSRDSSVSSSPTFSSSSRSGSRRNKNLFSAVRSFFRFIPCRGLALPPGPSDRRSVSLGSCVTGTLYGYRKGHIHFSIQENPKSPPVLLLELTTPTSSLVKEMASGLVRIALEAERTPNRGKLFQETIWTMYCNGRRSGFAMRRSASESDDHVLKLVQAVSMGAGVLPIDEEGPDGELMYMRARFDRIVASRDSEAFYMMNPDGNGGPELSIFLLRV